MEVATVRSVRLEDLLGVKGLDTSSIRHLLSVLFHPSSNLVPPNGGNSIQLSEDNPFPLVPLGPPYLNFGTDEAVASEYIQEVGRIVKRMEGIIASGHEDDLVYKDNRGYGSSYYEICPKDKAPEWSNPFDLFWRVSFNFKGWLKEIGGPDILPKDNINRLLLENKFITLIKSWNKYHLGYLQALNLPDPEERKRGMNRLGEEMFKTKNPDLKGEPTLEEISPYDNAVQWMVFNVLSVILSPEPRITPVARYRAIETLSHYGMKELTDKLFTEQRYHGGAPIEGFQSRFNDEYRRLPRSFWETDKERTSDTHYKWRSNRKILEIFGKQNSKTTDYGKALNTLVQKYPREALHIALLFSSSSREGEAGFKALTALGRLDPVTAAEVFGYGASYLNLSNMPSDDYDRLLEAMGVKVFDQDYAEQFRGLPPEQLLQVIRRQAKHTRTLEEQLAQYSFEKATAYFGSMSDKEVDKLDPKGYYRLLGVHPDTDPEDFDIVLKATYRRLALRYHTDKKERPDLAKMKALIEAYKVLSDPEKRAKYNTGKL